MNLVKLQLTARSLFCVCSPDSQRYDRVKGRHAFIIILINLPQVLYFSETARQRILVTVSETH